MENYKIRVNNEAESKEAQELFFELGYEWHAHGKKVSYLDVIAAGDFGYLVAWKTGCFSEHIIQMGCGREDAKEITLAELRDVVVLKRNDVKDANYRSKSVLDGFYFKSCDGVFYFMFEGEWVRSTTNTDEGLEPITKGLGLISGAEAKLAWAKGRDVQLIGKTRESDWLLISDCNLPLNIFEDDDFIFRLKPQNIKLELELPKPFEPKEDGYVYIIDDYQVSGYRKYYFEVKDDKELSFIGVWRTEDEIKQVVEQLRKIKGAL